MSGTPKTRGRDSSGEERSQHHARDHEHEEPDGNPAEDGQRKLKSTVEEDE